MTESRADEVVKLVALRAESVLTDKEYARQIRSVLRSTTSAVGRPRWETLSAVAGVAIIRTLLLVTSMIKSSCRDFAGRAIRAPGRQHHLHSSTSGFVALHLMMWKIDERQFEIQGGPGVFTLPLLTGEKLQLKPEGPARLQLALVISQLSIPSADCGVRATKRWTGIMPNERFNDHKRRNPSRPEQRK